MNFTGRFSVFFDGDCPLCKREIDWLRKRIDRSIRPNTEEIEFVDIADPSFAKNDCEKSFDELMAEIHGQDSNGQWVIGVEVFRRLYHAAGFRKSVWISRLPLVRHGLGFSYKVFARYRTRLTGRCKDGRCTLPKETRESNG